MYQIPILFIIFRREDTALQSFQKIKEIKPAKLYIASDGARDNVEGEKEIVESTRKAILNAIDWECDVHTLFQTENLGCALGVYTAINWLFANEEQGIIMEEDCIADKSFFLFVAEILERYKNDSRIGMIAGTNQVDNYVMPNSYCFSKYAACWGWATWKRAWENMKLNMEFLENHSFDVLSNRGYLGKEVSRWKYQINYIKKDYVSAWDWQWYFSLASQNQLCVFPKVNLISNIGFGIDSTHTADSDIYIEKQSLTFPLSHPVFVMPDMQFDKAFYITDNSIHNIIKRHIPYSIKQRIKNVLKHIRN